MLGEAGASTSSLWPNTASGHVCSHRPTFRLDEVPEALGPCGRSKRLGRGHRARRRRGSIDITKSCPPAPRVRVGCWKSDERQKGRAVSDFAKPLRKQEVEDTPTRRVRRVVAIDEATPPSCGGATFGSLVSPKNTSVAVSNAEPRRSHLRAARPARTRAPVSRRRSCAATDRPRSGKGGRSLVAVPSATRRSRGRHSHDLTPSANWSRVGAPRRVRGDQGSSPGKRPRPRRGGLLVPRPGRGFQ